MRTERRASSLLDHLEGRSQVTPESFFGFNKMTEDARVLINVGNGVLAVTPSDVKMLAHDPAYNFTTRTAASYDIGAMAPIFNRIITEALPDADDRRLYQLMAGNYLLPDCRHEVAQINYGEAGRCKSTPAEAIAGALGRDLVPRLSMGHICDPKSYHLPKLRHAAVNLGTELDAIEMSDSATFKAIVSGEPIEARPIYGSPFTMQTTCKLWFLANGLPRFKHGTEAELRRIRFLRFDYLPPTKDITLKARLAAERDGIFLWMLDGLRELLTLPEMPLGGKDSRAVHDRFRISNDPVGAFVKLRCRLDPNAKVEKTLLRREYGDFCDRYELAGGCSDWFFRALYERWPSLVEGRPGGGAKRARVVVGLALFP
jgi:putative DNA primase/helicase